MLLLKKRVVFTQVLAIAGTVLVWFPILAPFLTSFDLLMKRHVFRFDYLMPAELFPAALVGSGLLLWAALRTHAHVKLIAWGLGAAVGLPVAGQALAAVTGLASGETEPVGLWWILVLAALVGYSLALIFIGIVGILLLSDLCKI